MPKYALKREGEVVRAEEEGTENEVAEEMRTILGEKMEEAWRAPEARAMKRELSKTAKKWWKPQIEEALATTKYAEELEARAREIKYDEKVKKVWE